MAKHIIQDKRVDHGKFKPWRHTIFRVRRAAPSEQDVLLHFGRRVRYEVVKLDVKDLPAKDKSGRKITWIFNVGVRDASRKYLRKVKYTVFMPRPKRKNATFVYHDHRGLHWDKTPKYRGSKPPRPGMVQVDFETGDPGGGLR